MEKRSVRLKAFPWKATSEAYALPLNFIRKQRYIQKNLGATVIGGTIHPRSGHVSTQYIFQALVLLLSHNIGSFFKGGLKTKDHRFIAKITEKGVIKMKYVDVFLVSVS
ncbi:MAG TPA: hypothetical protein VGI33_16490 [Paenibacillus sp.]